MSDQNEISVSLDGVNLKGELATAFVPPIKRAAEMADSVLRLAQNLICSPLDYLSKNIEGFKAMYIEKIDKIPIERRREPSMRIACAVVANAAQSGDEHDLQNLFAELLASACDSELAKDVHPSFASVIAQMQSLEGHVLVATSLHDTFSNEWNRHLDNHGLSKNFCSVALANLTRLGLLGLPESRPVTSNLSHRSSFSDVHNLTSQERIAGAVRDIERDLEKMKEAGRREYRAAMTRRIPIITPYGRQFMAVVLPERAAS